MEGNQKINKKSAAILAIIVVVVVIIVVSIALGNKNPNNIAGGEQNSEEQGEGEDVGVAITGKAVEDKETKDYKISNIEIIAKESEAEIVLTIKNISSETTEERDVYIKYVNDQNEEIGQARVHLPEMEKDKSVTVSAIITKDLKEVADYVIEYK